MTNDEARAIRPGDRVRLAGRPPVTGTVALRLGNTFTVRWDFGGLSYHRHAGPRAGVFSRLMTVETRGA